MTNARKSFKSGFAGIFGKPNVGKSTLLNRLIAEKVAAISNRPQTTRNKIRGVCHLPGGQIVLVDTPGIHQAATKYNQYMIRTSVSAVGDVDLTLFMIDAKTGFGPDDQYALDLMKSSRAPKVLIINKIDLISKPEILTLIGGMAAKGDFAEIVPVSAELGDGLDRLKEVIVKYLPEGPEYFPKGTATDCPEKFILAEMIREKIMRLTHMELPHATAVAVDSVREGAGGVTVVEATIYAEKDSQKKILIGEKGSRLKAIGTAARKEIENRLGGKAYLNLFVKVRRNWRSDERAFKEFGYFDDSY
ncbi:MAG: GTPase Era [Nitrospinae bacterium]|nr:GTPase Era [Nitrospinota bacterium]